MTLDEAIIMHKQKADSYHKAMPNYGEAADHRQLAEWLTELKNLREENKVLMQECDRLIKEKGELLSKVSGGDTLRICQLEEQVKDWKEEYANLNKISYGFYEELKEWKENPFRRIKAECKENYYCNNCAFIDHCPFSNGNEVAAEYPMDWVIY